MSASPRKSSRSTLTATLRPRSGSRPLSTWPMPPRAISPSIRYRVPAPESSLGRWIGGSAPPSVSRSRTRGIEPTVAAIESRTRPAVAVGCESPSIPARKRQRGQSMNGESAGCSSPQLGQVVRSGMGGSPGSETRRRIPEVGILSYELTPPCRFFFSIDVRPVAEYVVGIPIEVAFGLVGRGDPRSRDEVGVGVGGEHSRGRAAVRRGLNLGESLAGSGPGRRRGDQFSGVGRRPSPLSPHPDRAS